MDDVRYCRRCGADLVEPGQRARGIGALCEQEEAAEDQRVLAERGPHALAIHKALGPLVWLGVASWAISVGKARQLLGLDHDQAEARYRAWLHSDEARALPGWAALVAREEADEARP